MDKPLSLKTQVRLLCHAIEARDLQAVREQLAAGCPTSHPELRANPLMLALQGADANIIGALLDAGAQLPDAEFYLAMKPALAAGNLRVLEHALEHGAITDADFSELLFNAISQDQEDLALRLLELGASPLATRWDNTCKHMATAFESAALWGQVVPGAHGYPRLIPAMLAPLTQKQKDSLLVDLVRANGKAGVIALLDAGADASLTVDGRTLLQLADQASEDLRRVLRSAETRASLEAAMGGPEAQAPAANRPPTL